MFSPFHNIKIGAITCVTAPYTSTPIKIIG